MADATARDTSDAPPPRYDGEDTLSASGHKKRAADSPDHVAKRIRTDLSYVSEKLQHPPHSPAASPGSSASRESSYGSTPSSVSQNSAMSSHFSRDSAHFRPASGKKRARQRSDSSENVAPNSADRQRDGRHQERREYALSSHRSQSPSATSVAVRRPERRHDEARAQRARSHQATVLMMQQLLDQHCKHLRQEALNFQTREHEIDDKIRLRQRDREAYERKTRSLQREFVALDAAAAAAYEQQQSVALPAHAAPAGTATAPAVDFLASLLPGNVTDREAAMRKLFDEHAAAAAAFLPSLTLS